MLEKPTKKSGTPLGSNRLPRRRIPSTTAVSILVTLKSHWGATPLSDGNQWKIPQNGWFIMENPIKMGWFGGINFFRFGPIEASSCHRCTLKIQNKIHFQVNHMAIVISPHVQIGDISSFMVAFSSHLCLFTPNSKSPPFWALHEKIGSLVAAGCLRLESSAWRYKICKIPTKVFRKWWGMPWLGENSANSNHTLMASG